MVIKNLILTIATLFILFTSCEQQNTTPPSDNIEDQDWYKELAKPCEENTICAIFIMQGLYNNDTVYFTSLSGPLCDPVFQVILYNKYGEVIRGFNYDEIAAFDSAVTDIKTIYRCDQDWETVKVEDDSLGSVQYLTDTIITKKSSVLTSEEDDYYTRIWKKEVLKLNQISEDYFTEHYKKITISSNTWNGGITFRVDYLFVFDWLSVKVNDEFMIKLNSSWELYPQLNIPRDVMLDESWAVYNIENKIWDDGILIINKITSLPFKTYEEAYKACIAASKCETFKPNRISFYVPGKVPRMDGSPYFIGSGFTDNNTYDCIEGYFNLFDGSSEFREGYCGPVF